MHPLHRLSLRIFPELLLLKTEQERKTALGKAIHNPASVICLLAVVGLMAWLGFAVMRFVWELPWVVWLPLGCLLGLLAGFLLNVAPLVVSQKAIRRKLRGLMVQAGIPICLGCGYDLRGQVDCRCPECGAAFDPDLLSRRPGSHTDR